MSIIWVGPNPYENWQPSEQCFGQYATDDLGMEINPRHESASRFCAQAWLKHKGVPNRISDGFNRWCLDHYEGQPITVLNDINGWKPIDFVFAWEKYILDLRADPARYGCA